MSTIFKFSWTVNCISHTYIRIEIRECFTMKNSLVRDDFTEGVAESSLVVPVLPLTNVRLFSRDPTSSTFFSSSMAALYEGYTLCGLVPGQTLTNSGIQGIEAERDSDHVVVTDSTRSVTLYKVTFKDGFEEALPTCVRAARVGILGWSSRQKPPQQWRDDIHLR